jgi:MFS family permease
MGDLVGRKRGLIMSCLVFSLGVGLQLDTRWGVFVIGRVIAGFGVVCKLFHRSFPFPISWHSTCRRVLCHVSYPCINRRYGGANPEFFFSRLSFLTM